MPYQPIGSSPSWMTVVGSGSAHKRQVQRMVAAILGLAELPEPLDASDALAVAVCLAHRTRKSARFAGRKPRKGRT